DARWHAIAALGWIGRDAAEATPDLVRATRALNSEVVRKAIEALGRTATDGDAATAALVAAGARNKHDDQIAAAFADLGKLAVPSLLTIARKPAAERYDAIRRLGAIGPDASGAVPLLRDEFLAFRNDHGVYADALVKIGPAAIPAFVAGLKSDDDK